MAPASNEVQPPELVTAIKPETIAQPIDQTAGIVSNDDNAEEGAAQVQKLHAQLEIYQRDASTQLLCLHSTMALHRAVSDELAQVRKHADGLQLKLDGSATAYQHLFEELQTQRALNVKQLERYDEEHCKWESRLHDILVNNEQSCPELVKEIKLGAEQKAQHAETVRQMNVRTQHLREQYDSMKQQKDLELQLLRIVNDGLREQLQRAGNSQNMEPLQNDLLQQLRDQNNALRQQLSESRSINQTAEAQLQHLRQLNVKHQEVCAELRNVNNMRTQDGEKILAQKEHLRKLSIKHTATLADLQKLRTVNM